MTFFDLLVTPKGRIGRAGFAAALFIHLVILKGFGITDWALGIALGHGYLGIHPSAWLFTLAELWMLNVLFVRRWHDLGWSGRTSLLVLVPIVGLFMLTPAMIALLFMPGKPEANRYGPPEPFEQTIAHVRGPLAAFATFLVGLIGLALIAAKWAARNIGFTDGVATSGATPSPRRPVPTNAGPWATALPPVAATPALPVAARPRAKAASLPSSPPVVVRRSRRGLFG